jgi:Tol biopolymer transport system component
LSYYFLSRYGININSYLFSFYDNGISQLGKMNLDIFEITKVSQGTNDERLPMCNETDDWIYFSSKKNDTFDIYRKKIDGSSSEPVIVEDYFDVTTFSINRNGTFIVASKYNDQKSYIIVWDILHQKILPQLETTNMGVAYFHHFQTMINTSYLQTGYLITAQHHEIYL